MAPVCRWFCPMASGPAWRCWIRWWSSWIPRRSDSTCQAPVDRRHRLCPTGLPIWPGCWAGYSPSWIVGVVDVLGLSWGGALAQQFAFQNPRRCRRLVLVSTGTGALMVPARPWLLAKMLTPHRFSDPDYAASIAGELYGGTVRAHGDDVARLFMRQLHAGSKIGYLTSCSRVRCGPACSRCPRSGKRP